jgi:hypothetical protein
MFRHHPDVPLPQAQAPELAAAATHHNQHTSELDDLKDLKAMMSKLIADGAAQTALITHLLQEE